MQLLNRVVRRVAPVAALWLSVTVAGADEVAIAGQTLFERKCAECHAAGAGHPGTQRLAWKLGAAQSVLAERGDLAPEYVWIVVRQGLAEMPPVRPTELSDDELRALIQYLTRARGN